MFAFVAHVTSERCSARAYSKANRAILLILTEIS